MNGFIGDKLMKILQTGIANRPDVIKQKETGRGGLTNQTRDLLKWLEARYGICWWRNNPILKGSDGRPDYDLLISTCLECKVVNHHLTPYYIALELKVGKGKLSRKQEREKERVERTGGQWFTCYNIYEVAKIFQDLGMEVEIT